MKIKLRKADKLFTQVVRLKFEYTCQKCGKEYNPYNKGKLRNLGVSHYYGRSRENTRFDMDNVTLLCNFPCHRRWEGEEREDYKKYMIDRLTQKGFDLLTVRANTYFKRDDKMNELILTEWLKEMDNKDSIS